jgi:hypothetical protein
MRKHLFSFIAAVGVLFAGAGTAWADDLKFGLKFGSASDTEYTIVNGDETSATVTTSLGSKIKNGKNKTMYFSGTATSSTTSLCYGMKTAQTSKTEDVYLGYKLSLGNNKILSISSISVAVGADKNYSWQVEIVNASNAVLYSSDAYTISNFNSAEDVTNTTKDFAVSQVAALQEFSGDIYVRLYYWYNATDKYFTIQNFTVTGTISEGTASCKDVTFSQNAQFDFSKKAYTASLNTTTANATIYYTTSTDADATLDTKYEEAIPISAEGTTIKAQATAVGYNPSNTTTSVVLKAPADYVASKKYVAWVYQDAYSDKVTYDYTKDPLYTALTADYNVVPVAISKSSTWSAECPTLDKADVIVMTEALTGDGALSVSLKSLAGSVPMVNMKAYSYKSSSWNWGTPAAPATATGVITPSYTNYKLFDGVTFDDDGKTITLANEGSSNAMVQTVSDLGNAVPGLPITIAKCGDGIAIYASDNYLLYALSCNSFTYYNENATTILKNAVNRLATGESLAEMGESTVCVDPIATFSAIDMSTYTYLLTLTATDNSAIYYTRADGVKTLYTEPISLKRKEVITVIAEAEGKTSSNEITVTAPDLSGSGSETMPAATKGTTLVKTCYSLDGTYIADPSKYSGITGVKMRLGSGYFVFNVNTGYIINKIEVTAIGNDCTFDLTGVYVDDAETSVLGETLSFESSTTDGSSTTSFIVDNLNATKTIKFTVANVEGGQTQANMAYTFYYTIPEDPTILHTVTFSDAVEGYATFCPAKNVLIPEGVTAYIAKAENNALTLSEIKVCIPANTGVILKGTAGETAEFETTGFTADVTGNELTGVTKETTIEAKSVYVLSAEGEEGVGFFVFSGTTIPANKAYYKAPAASTISALHFNFGETEEPGNVTGINAVAIENNAQQVIYDLRGRRVQSLDRPGLYIVNGKKVAIQ